MRKPKVRNKYNITLKDIRNMSVDRSKLEEPLFWRNNVVKAWCILGSVGNKRYCTDSSYWIGVYDDEKKKVTVDLSAYGGMAGYKIEKFYRWQDIENEQDLEIQELLLAKVNELIDKGVFKLNKKIGGFSNESV